MGFAAIESRDYWVSVGDALQQHWALVEAEEDGSATVYRLDGSSVIFDTMRFECEESARARLRRDGFVRFSEDPWLQTFLAPPEPPFRVSGES